MRFIANGPDIPDELLVARDAGDVIVFCGAGVSQADARLPDFPTLGRRVIEILGAARDSRARLLLERALNLDPMPGVGGLVATDRVFGLLEREFEVSDVHMAVAEAIRPAPGVDLGAHRILLDLATWRGVTRLVTTNFDLLFETCDASLPSSGPPNLPDPRSDADFRGVVHLHGRVDATYRMAQDEEFVISSADFGRAYLSSGWATRFIQRLLSRFQILFVGYSADDPPVQYLLEGLNLRAGTRNRLYALQSGEERSAVALWEHRGVQAIPFDISNGFAPLWDTLRAWAARARDGRAWHDGVLARAAQGAGYLAPYERGQVAHILSTVEGARRVARAPEPIGADWLLVADPAQRYAQPGQVLDADGTAAPLDPFEALGLDSDLLPDAPDPEDTLRDRKVPEGAVDVLRSNHLDHGHSGHSERMVLRGVPGQFRAELPPRLSHIGAWLRRVAHQPVTLWWAAHQPGLHPSLTEAMTGALLHQPQRFPDRVRHGWRMLLAAWADRRENPDLHRYGIEQRAQQEGWSASLVRELAGIYRPRLTVRPAFGARHPLSWTTVDQPDDVVHVGVEYPHPHTGLELPDEFVAYAVECFRGNLDLAVALEREASGHDRVYLQTTRGPDGGPDLVDDTYGLAVPVIHFQKLMTRLARLDTEAARRQVLSWPVRDEYVFARLRIWAVGSGLTSADEAGVILLSLPAGVFWDSTHERDLLHALRDRWADLSPEHREALERRLLTDSYPWDTEVPGGPEQVNAYHRLDRLHWLSTHGVTFACDLPAVMDLLRAAAPRWTTRSGDAAADSTAPEAYYISTDTTPDPLLDVPVPEILRRASEVSRLDFAARTERDPFRGLAAQKPVRALGALTHAARLGDVPRQAWSAFLHSQARQQDSLRMVRAIAIRLQALGPTGLHGIAYPVSEWMQAMAGRFNGDAANVLPSLWGSLIAALRLTGAGRPRSPGQSWAVVALNAPVGKLCDLLLKDPATDGLTVGSGLPPYWTARAADLLSLPDDLRRQALVMFGRQITWLFALDPAWTGQQLLSLVDDDGQDGDALWEGVLWGARVPRRKLFLVLKQALLARVTRSRPREERGILAGFLLAGWGSEAETGGRLITDAELREALIHADDEFRQRLLSQLEQWSTQSDGPWRGRIVPFLVQVWPKQRALRTPAMSSHLANLALACGDLMPAVAAALLPRLVPIRNGYLRFPFGDELGADHPAKAYPSATLDLLWAILGEDATSWPDRTARVLDLLAQEPETATDSKLLELRRRLDLS